ncbi:MAG: hypothetical protein R3C02_05410 [Planctomycetaceae bacterium]
MQLVWGSITAAKPYCRRMSACAFADVGDLKEAREQLSRLRALVSEKFYQSGTAGRDRLAGTSDW